MRRWLQVSLAATLAATAAAALWPVTPLPDPLLPVRKPAGPGSAVGQGGAPAPGAALPTPTAEAATPLPTRPADWPAPPAAARAAWAGAPEPAPRPAAAATASPAARATTPAPVFPYRWIGQLEDGGPPQLLLASAQRTVAVRLGETLEGRWQMQHGPDGALQALPLPGGPALPVPGAPPAAPSAAKP